MRKGLTPLSVATVLIVFLSGCVSSQRVAPTSAAHLRAINQQAETNDARITLHDGTRVRGRALHVAPDSTSWADVRTRTITIVPTDAVASVGFVDRGRGALIGATAGAVAGGVYHRSVTGSEDMLFPISLLLIEVPSMLVGALVGAIVGGRQEYRFRSPPEGAHE